MRRRQEKSRIEDPVVDRALKELLVPSIPLKLLPGSETGRPDDIFLIPHGRPLFIEFKWGAWSPTPKQIYWHQILRELGYDVQVHNNVGEALEAIALKVVTAALHAEGCEIPPGTRCWDIDVRPRLKKDLHYSRSVQFLKEAGRRKENAGNRTLKGLPPSLARRGR